MADNTQVVAGGGDTIRDKDRSGTKTQIVGLDIGIGTGTEALMSSSNPLPAYLTATASRAGAYTASAASSLTTELDSLAAGSWCAPSSAIDNSSALDLYDDLELTVTFGSAPVVNTVVEVYLLPSVDGANYADGASGTTTFPAPNLYVGGFPVRAVTTAQRLVFRGVPLPPGLFKYQVKNGTAQAFPSSGSVLKRRPYRLQLG